MKKKENERAAYFFENKPKREVIANKKVPKRKFFDMMASKRMFLDHGIERDEIPLHYIDPSTGKLDADAETKVSFKL